MKSKRSSQNPPKSHFMHFIAFQPTIATWCCVFLCDACISSAKKPQNVAHYQRMQYAMLEKSGVFAKVWMQNVYKDQSLDYTQKFPVSAGARHIYLREQREEKEQKIQKLSQEYGLFFFVLAAPAQMASLPSGKCIPTVIAKVNAHSARTKYLKKPLDSFWKRHYIIARLLF